MFLIISKNLKSLMCEEQKNTRVGKELFFAGIYATEIVGRLKAKLKCFFAEHL